MVGLYVHSRTKESMHTGYSHMQIVDFTPLYEHRDGNMPTEIKHDKEYVKRLVYK